MYCTVEFGSFRIDRFEEPPRGISAADSPSVPCPKSACSAPSFGLSLTILTIACSIRAPKYNRYLWFRWLLFIVFFQLEVIVEYLWYLQFVCVFVFSQMLCNGHWVHKLATFCVPFVALLAFPNPNFAGALVQFRSIFQMFRFLPAQTSPRSSQHVSTTALGGFRTLCSCP